MSLVPYAGHDPAEGKRAFLRPQRALLMFRNGKDTSFIAGHFNVTEATAQRWINVERATDLGLVSPYRSEN